MTLAHRHAAAAARQRRIIFQDDILANAAFRCGEVGTSRLDRLIDFYMSRLEAPNQIDSVWHEWGEGNTAVWPSEVLPRTENVFPGWWEAGIDPVKALLDETRKRRREVFFSYRINGSDNDDLFDPPHPLEGPTPLKARHPDRLIHKWHVYWDFRCEGVRDLKLAALREVASMYDYDGISIDFARVPVLFPEGEQWQHRDLLTGFMREVRSALQEIAGRRGRPYLLAARIPEDIPGCRFDGIDIETWVAGGMVDILVIGTRTAAADVAGFRRPGPRDPGQAVPELGRSPLLGRLPASDDRGLARGLRQLVAAEPGRHPHLQPDVPLAGIGAQPRDRNRARTSPRQPWRRSAAVRLGDPVPRLRRNRQPRNPRGPRQDLPRRAPGRRPRQGLRSRARRLVHATAQLFPDQHAGPAARTAGGAAGSPIRCLRSTSPTISTRPRTPSTA